MSATRKGGSLGRQKVQRVVPVKGFSALDGALKSARQSQSKEEALASLAKATALLNIYTSPPGAASSRSVTSPPQSLDEALLTTSFLNWGPLDPSTWPKELEDRLQKYFEAVKVIVEKYGPAQYQISLGIPSGVSVIFTWNVPQKP
jgi:hypothetical protein